MTSTTAKPATADVQFTLATLLNVADAIKTVLLPALPAAARNRADECIAVLARAATRLESVGEATAPPTEETEPAQWHAVACAEEAALNTLESSYRSVMEGIYGDRETAFGRAFDEKRFASYLHAHNKGGPDLEVIEAHQLAGGRSKQTILVTLRGARELPSEIVVRQDWATAVTGTSVVTEYELLLRVWQHGIRVPQPLLLERSPDVLGAPFIIVTRVRGAGQGDIFHPPRSESLALQVAEQLGRLHALPVQEFQRLGVPLQAYQSAQLHAGLVSFKALHAQLGAPIRSIGIALAWMERNLHRVSGSAVLLHNDLGCHNFLIDGDELTAILDWELAHIGNPAADLGYIRGWIEKMTSWERFLERYRRSGGPEVDAFTLQFYTLWSGVRLYCLLLQARAGVATGGVKDTEITYACANFTPQLIQRIVSELTAILKS